MNARPVWSEGTTELDPDVVPTLSLRDVSVTMTSSSAKRLVVANLDLKIYPGEIVGLVGESGSGKSTVCRVIAGLLHPEMALSAGSILLQDVELSKMRPRAVHRLRPRGVSMVFQDPLAALNPVMPIGDQVVEAVTGRSDAPRKEARAAAAQLLERMGIEDARRRLKMYPYELSGGQRQRVVIAMAVAADPILLLADEPTSALDVSTQAQLLQLFKEIAAERKLAVLFVSHDYGVISEVCSRVYVMYAGRILESGQTSAILGSPAHPYTARLIDSLPSLDKRMARLPVIPGMPPGLETPLSGCPFHPRCDLAQPECSTTIIALKQISETQASACILLEDGLIPDFSRS
jgi:oligopeptide/dipeptide ABC transporter ATP-binding protein